MMRCLPPVGRIELMESMAYGPVRRIELRENVALTYRALMHNSILNHSASFFHTTPIVLMETKLSSYISGDTEYKQKTLLNT